LKKLKMQINEASKAAKQRFLGKEVVGIGVSNPERCELLFLLDHQSDEVEREITAWAQEQKVTARFQVSGRIHAS
jgi:hypothetical protein